MHRHLTEHDAAQSKDKSRWLVAAIRPMAFDARGIRRNVCMTCFRGGYDLLIVV